MKRDSVKSALRFTAAMLTVLIISPLAASCGGDEALTDIDTEPEVTTDAYDGRTYSNEERLALIDGAVLKLPSSFYDPDAKAEYFEKLNAIRDEYVEPGVIPDRAFWEFEQAKAKLTVSYSVDYPVAVLNIPENLGKSYEDGHIIVIDGGEVIESDVSVKVRGNSTASAEKKPYNVKFPEKVSLFGIEEGKKWSFLANFFDKTLIRNKLALDFASELELDYVSQSSFCEVWVNGKFVGNYLCCEPVSDGKNRVEIDTSKYDFILEVSPFGGWDFMTGAGVELIYDSPEEPTEKQKKHLSELLEKAETAMKSGDPKQYSKYIDVDSFVDLYVMMELFKDVDGYWKSLYFYVKDDILYAGPPWDFDLTCGNVSTSYKEDNYYDYHNTHGHGDGSGDSTHGLRMVHGWWKILLGDEEFSSLVRERYVELQPLIINLFSDNELGQNRIDLLVGANADSFAREYKQNETEYNAGWDIDKCYSVYAGESKGDYDDNIEFLRGWLEQRNDWLLENIGR